MSQEKIQEILASFEYYDGVYKREAVQAAIELRDEITPHLINILAQVRDDPAKYILDENYFAHLYAFMLLGYFNETRAHQVIVELFSLPEQYISPLFEDSITEDLPGVLYNTCGGSLAQIKTLVENEAAYEYCRSAALRAMNYAVAGGMAARETVIEYYRQIFTEAEAKSDEEFFTLAADDVLDLCPEEIKELVYRGFEKDLIDPIMFDREYFDQLLAEGPDKSMARLRKEMEQHSLKDVDAAMSWWAAFDSEPSYRNPFSSPELFATAPKSTRKKKTEKKKKRKIAKASKKKNRR